MSIYIYTCLSEEPHILQKSSIFPPQKPLSPSKRSESYLTRKRHVTYDLVPISHYHRNACVCVRVCMHHLLDNHKYFCVFVCANYYTTMM